MKFLIALTSGLLFGLGLTIAQMVDPNKVLNFLNLFGNWDASLLFVMAAAFSVFSLAYWFFIKKRTISLTGVPIRIGTITHINKQLIFGAAIFGLGWGLTGICPGPAVANISGGEPKMLAFVVVMVLGMKSSEWVKARFLSL